MSNQQGGFFGLLRMHELYKYLIVVEQKCDTSIEVILHDYVTDVHFVSRQDRLLGLSTLDFLITVLPFLNDSKSDLVSTFDPLRYQISNFEQ